MKQFFKKLLICYLCAVVCVINPFFIVKANASMTGWTLAQLTMVSNGVKAVATNNGVTSTVTKMPKTVNMGNFLKGSGGGLALAAGIYALLGAVDWVLDPANNRVTFKSPQPVFECNFYSFTGNLQSVASHVCAAGNPWSPSTYSGTYRIATGDIVYVLCDNGFNATIHCNKTTKDYISLDQISDKLKQMALAGDATAIDAVKIVAKDEIKLGEWDTDFENAKDNTKPDDPPKPDTDKGILASILSMLSSIFSAITNLANQIINGLAKVINAAIDKLISFFTGFIDWLKQTWSKFWDYVNGDIPEDKSTDVQLEQPSDIRDPSSFDKDYVNFNGQCPASPSKTFIIGPQTVNLSFDLTPFCDFASLVRPAVLGIAALYSMFVISLAIRET